MDYTEFHGKMMNKKTTEISQGIIFILCRLVSGKTEEDQKKPQGNSWPIFVSNLSFTSLIFIILINSKHK